MKNYLVYEVKSVSEAYQVKADSVEDAENKLRLYIKGISLGDTIRRPYKDMSADSFVQCEGEL
jgi:hypothetical protein